MTTYTDQEVLEQFQKVHSELMRLALMLRINKRLEPISAYAANQAIHVLDQGLDIMCKEWTGKSVMHPGDLKA
jgi:hypothetical protein